MTKIKKINQKFVNLTTEDNSKAIGNVLNLTKKYFINWIVLITN